MLDMTMFRENSDVIRADHDRRGIPHDAIDEVIRLDEETSSAGRGTRQREALPRPRSRAMMRLPRPSWTRWLTSAPR